MTHELLGQLAHVFVITTAYRERKLLLQSLLKLFVGIGKLNAADALVSGGNHDPPQRRIGASVADGRCNGAAAVFPWLHSQFRSCARVKTAGRTVSSTVHGAGDRVT